MPLPDDYLAYPHRRHGMDNPFYGWEPADRRPKAALKSSAKSVCTLIVPLEFFPLDPPARPFKHPGAMVTPYPDLRHYTTRDYGNRVGVFRLLRAFSEAGVKATFAANAAVVQRYPPLIEAVVTGGHELAAHGVSTAHIHHDGLTPEEERAFIADTRRALPDAVSWLSPARNESFRTLELLAEAGFRICLDWEADMRPLALKTPSGSMTALPNYNELSDFKILVERSQSEDQWADQILEAASYQAALHEVEGAGAFAFVLTPYVAGLPFRISALRRMLSGLAAMPGLEILTARDAVSAFA